MNGRPRFLITIDTEGDDLWARPREISTRNAAFLPRFQALCEHHRLRPTYLVNYEMARDPVLVEFGKDVLRRDAGEIGMHLHAWNNPPLHRLTADDHAHMPYLIEYPEPVLRDKVAVITDLLEDTFCSKMVSHRAGRWSFDAVYARALMDRGYLVDCSVTPHVSWRTTPGAPAGEGGTDFSRFPDRAYFISERDVGRPGRAPLLEVPMTVRCGRHRLRQLLPDRLRNAPQVQRALRHVAPVSWLRPTGKNRRQLLALLPWALERKIDYVEFMLHSSELMPGGSPSFRTGRDIEGLYSDLEALFAAAATSGFVGATLREYHGHFQQAVAA